MIEQIIRTIAWFPHSQANPKGSVAPTATGEISNDTTREIASVVGAKVDTLNRCCKYLEHIL